MQKHPHRGISTEDTLLTLADHLPAEAAEALLELATGGKPRAPQSMAAANPFDHPDAQRRFRVMTNVEELERALEFPWDKWTVFLHPEEREWVERDYAGPARVSGSAGTGKTIVALHRAVFLARNHPESRVLLTTFSEALANALRTRLRRLVSNEPRLAERRLACRACGGGRCTHIPEGVRSANPQIPWRLIIATRNRLIHGYLGIDNDTLWSIVSADVPALLPVLIELKSRL